MSLGFWSFGSGSSGNSYLIQTEDTSVLVDAGCSGKRIFTGLAERGLKPSDLDAVLITHEHEDHVRGLGMLIKRAPGLTVKATRGTMSRIMPRLGFVPEEDSPRANAETVTVGEVFDVGSLRVRPFRLEHDAAEPCGYSFSSGGRMISVVTDTGRVTDDMILAVKESDLLVLEANYERNILLMGRYPYSLKMRILSDYGHVSNEDAAAVLAKVLRSREKDNMPVFALAHLSKENNTPEMARMTVSNILYEEGFREDRDFALKVFKRDEFGEYVRL
ncbi:MAG: MBL fold metallo-hydrolase [Eubacterium sp.]|nr:MBL fold metallo-hydrolase [Eubacterium sp.]